MKNVCTATLVLLLGCGAATVAFAQAEPVTVAEFENDVEGWRTTEHAIGLVWSEDDAGGGMGSASFLIDPSQPDDDSPEGKFEGDLPEDLNVGDFEYVSFYYKCDTEAYTGSSLFMMPMLDGGAGGGGAFHTGEMVGDGEWHYQEFHRDEFELWWGDWTWETSRDLVIGFTETNDRGPCEIWIDHIVFSNNPGDGMILTQEGPPQVTQTQPADGAHPTRLREVVVTFNMTVQGVAEDGSDLLVNGEPATSVSTPNDRIFTFTGFPEPAAGETVEIELQPGSIQSEDGEAFEGYSFSVEIYEPKTYTAPFAASAPALDGVIEDGEYPGEFVDDWRDNLGPQAPEGEADWSPAWTATHDSEYYYVAFRTNDDAREVGTEPWEADNLEVFIDGPNAKSGTGAQFRVNWDGSEWVSSAAETWEFEVGDTGEQWVVEARFDKAEMEIPASGTIGFNLQPSDNDDGTRGTYHFWEDSPANDNPWDDASAWGNVILEAGDTGVSDWHLF